MHKFELYRGMCYSMTLSNIHDSTRDNYTYSLQWLYNDHIQTYTVDEVEIHSFLRGKCVASYLNIYYFINSVYFYVTSSYF